MTRPQRPDAPLAHPGSSPGPTVRDTPQPASFRPTPGTGSAYHILALLMAITLLAAALPAADWLLRAREQDRPAAHWMKALDMSMPAFWPAGAAQRLGWNSTPAVDPRPAPFIPTRTWDAPYPPAGDDLREAPCDR